MGPGSGCAPVSLTHMALASPSTALRWALQGHWCLPRCVPALGSRNRPFWLWMAHETEPPLLFFFLSLFNYLLRLSKAKGNCEIKSVKYNNIFKRTWIPLFLFATEKAPRRHRLCLISKQPLWSGSHSQSSLLKNVRWSSQVKGLVRRKAKCLNQKQFSNF